MEPGIRVGIGHDTHRLVAGRPLILAGVRIEHDRGLSGHSDADVVLHAVTDALLGAAGLGDIGDAFPDTDPRWRDAESSLFVRSTLDRLEKLGFRPVNLDVIIFAEEPKLGPIKDRMRHNLAGLLGLPPEAVNVKAKTGESVGHIGRKEAIACQAVVLIAPRNHAAPPSGKSL
ncbi:MAG: 2-C-methyl-D-erythritol 2,4-cyclodiphosphate synthase [Gemmatales bacterium]|nr:2-C-methyl-D-erythritol 2,4-cyclodiphosphate synthase [Gemmatales bacterium]MDW8385472.1 2-C-methyl-D-erythritol 2,4-cyclodiphosphate synthase [Gemmatales bacterium]